MTARISVLILVLVSGILLGGCGTVQTKAFMVQPADGHGHVIVSLRNNERGITPVGVFSDRLAFEYILLEREGEDASRQSAYRLWPWETSIGGEVIYVGSLPAGRYRLHSGYVRAHQDNRVYHLTVPIDERLGQFDVLPNVITNLGSVITTPIHIGSAQSSHYGRLPLSPNLDDVVRTYLREAGHDEALTGSLGWLREIPSDYSMISTQYARARPLTSGPAITDGANRLLVPVATGDVMVRNPDGQWHRVPSGESATIWTISDGIGGVFAAKSFGIVMTSDSLHSGQWQALPRLSSYSDVLHAGINDDGKIYAVTLDRKPGYHLSPVRSDPQGTHRFSASAHLALYLLEEASGQWQARVEEGVPRGALPGAAFRLGDSVIVQLGGDGAGLHAVGLASGKITTEINSGRVNDWFIAPYGEKSYVRMKRRLSLVERYSVSLHDVSGEEANIGTDGKLLAEIQHMLPPVKLDDGRIISFGKRILVPRSRSQGRPNPVHDVLPNATVKKGDKEVPYDPEEGTYFISNEDGDWTPFAIPPQGCWGMQPMMVADGRLVQDCRNRRAWSVEIGSAEWEEESSRRNIQVIDAGV